MGMYCAGGTTEARSKAIPPAGDRASLVCLAIVVWEWYTSAMTMLNARLAVYLFRIQQKVQKGEYIDAPMICPECSEDAEKLQHSADHIIFTQKEEGVDLYYVALCCEGYWAVDPQVAGLSRGNWEKYRDEKTGIITHLCSGGCGGELYGPGPSRCMPCAWIAKAERDARLTPKEAYRRYVDEGIADTDGHYSPISYEAFTSLYYNNK